MINIAIYCLILQDTDLLCRYCLILPDTDCFYMKLSDTASVKTSTRYWQMRIRRDCNWKRLRVILFDLQKEWDKNWCCHRVQISFNCQHIAIPSCSRALCWLLNSILATNTPAFLLLLQNAELSMHLVWLYVLGGNLYAQIADVNQI